MSIRTTGFAALTIAELPRWAEICHDYEIIQPFPQFGRPVFALTGQERDKHRLDRFCDAQLPTDRFLALHRSPGWGAAALWDSGRTAATGGGCRVTGS